MSLINRMLQELDARSGDGAATSAIHGAVRAVPERRRVHPAWWLALGFAGLAVAAAGLWAVRKTAPEVQVAQVAQPAPREVTLKMASDLAVVPLPALPPAGAAASVPLIDKPVGVDVKPPDAKPAIPEQANKSIPEPPPAVAKPASVSKETPAVKGQSVAVAKTVPQAPHMAEPISPPIAKQVKEPSPQQRAENDYRRATSLLQQGRASDAIEVLEQVLLLDPQHVAARQTLVRLLLESKRQDDAMRKMREGLSLDVNQPGLAMILARQQVDKGELRVAVETLQKTLPYAVERADYQAFLAALLQRQANHKEAAEHYLAALRNAPQNGVWWMGLAISLQTENRLPEARDAFGRAKASNSLTPELLAFVEQRLAQLQH